MSDPKAVIFIPFNKPDINGTAIARGAISEKNLQELKIMGEILDYEIDNDGIRIIKRFKLTGMKL